MSYFLCGFCSVMFLVCLLVLFGSKTDDHYPAGYAAGWQARQSMVDADNARMRSIGICTYAALACGDKK